MQSQTRVKASYELWWGKKRHRRNVGSHIHKARAGQEQFLVVSSEGGVKVEEGQGKVKTHCLLFTEEGSAKVSSFLLETKHRVALLKSAFSIFGDIFYSLSRVMFHMVTLQ